MEENIAENLLAGLIANAQVDAENYRNDGDYIGDDGLLYCGKCHTKKQTILNFKRYEMANDNKQTIVRCVCKCEAAAREERRKEEERKQEMRRLEKLRSASLIEARLKNARFTTFEQRQDNVKLYQIADRYVRNFEEMYKKSQGILFYGTVGTGKSYTAACIANELLDRRIPVVMTSFVKILQSIQNTQEDESILIARLNAARLLIIDDLGTERNTDYALEKVYNVIDSRYLTGKPLILTTNLTLQEMQGCTDTRYKRIYDRIFEMCYPVRVTGKSWRTEQAAERYDSMKMLLEGENGRKDS